MSLDFQQVQDQVRQLGETALERQRELDEKQELADHLLEKFARQFDFLQQRVAQAAHNDPTLRCALPLSPEVAAPEALNAAYPTPPLPRKATILAADGSQISPDRHAEVQYCLINVGTIQMSLSSTELTGSPEPPKPRIFSQLLYNQELYTPHGMITEATLALMRDTNERTRLADLAENLEKPVITFTDGQMELMVSAGEEMTSFQKYLEDYRQALKRLYRQGVIVSGYLEKPFSSPLTRLLEVAGASEQDLAKIKDHPPLQGVMDFRIFSDLLKPGERSAVFSLRSPSAKFYKDELALHFFYLNFGRPGHHWVSRVDIPAWVARDSDQVGVLHAALVDQCKIMGGRFYPYLLHRAHETAVVTLEDKEQVTQMIVLELRRRGAAVGERSQKQEAKQTAGRTRY
jgi:hypothetical protein